MILDIRRTPSDGDLQMLSWLAGYGRRAIVVLTKSDKLTKNERARQIALISKTIGIPAEELIPFSALKKEGKERVWEAVVEAAGLAGEPEVCGA